MSRFSAKGKGKFSTAIGIRRAYMEISSVGLGIFGIVFQSELSKSTSSSPFSFEICEMEATPDSKR